MFIDKKHTLENNSLRALILIAEKVVAIALYFGIAWVTYKCMGRFLQFNSIVANILWPFGILLIFAIGDILLWLEPLSTMCLFPSWKMLCAVQVPVKLFYSVTLLVFDVMLLAGVLDGYGVMHTSKFVFSIVVLVLHLLLVVINQFKYKCEYKINSYTVKL